MPVKCRSSASSPFERTAILDRVPRPDLTSRSPGPINQIANTPVEERVMNLRRPVGGFRRGSLSRPAALISRPRLGGWRLHKPHGLAAGSRGCARGGTQRVTTTTRKRPMTSVDEQRPAHQPRFTNCGWSTGRLASWACRSRIPEFVKRAEDDNPIPAADPRHPRHRTGRRPKQCHQHPPAANDLPRLQLPHRRRAHRGGQPHPRRTLPDTPGRS